jgi:type 1 glutamine amidotransferase
MKKSLLVILFLLGLSIGFAFPRASVSSPDATWKAKPKRSDATQVLVVTGGHDHDADFYSLFDDDDVRAVVDPHPAALGGGIRNRADVLVLYDMIREMSERQVNNLRDFVEHRKGVVVLHHAICDNVNLPWWYEEVVGGRYLFEPVNGRVSSYSHDEDQLITPVGDHPITRGLKPFRIHDETYKGLWISPQVNVILKSDNPTSDGPVAWISPYEKSRVVYIQLGHDRNANLNPHYQRLVRNAIFWAAGRLQ